MNRYALLLALVAIVISNLDTVEAFQIDETTVDLGLDGAATVSVLIRFNRNELVAVPLLGQPETFTIRAVAADGSTIPFSLADDHVVLEATGAVSPLKLQYSVYTLTSKNGRFWNVTVVPTQTTLLQLPKGAVLIGIDRVPEDIYVRDGRINLILDQRSWGISYFLPPITAEPTEPFLGVNPLFVIGAAVVAGAVILALKILRKKPPVLRPDDRRILEYLRTVGGQAYESDLVRELGIPKSTVWRGIKRLSEANLVTIDREGNRVKVIAK